MERNRLFCRFAALSVGTVMLLSLASCAKEPAETTAPKEPVTAEKAITQLQEQSEALGFDNALDELEEKNTASIGGDTYIRLQQYYEGIPVYGKTIVYAANEQGELTSVTGNVQDIDPDIDLTSTVIPEQAQESIRAYAAEVLEQENTNISYSEPNACIYNGNKLAYLYTVTMDGNFFAAHEVLVDAHDASILEWNTYAASFDTNQDVLEAADVACESDDSNNFRLADTRRNHRVYYLDLETTIQYPTLEAVVGNDDFLATAVPDQTASGETYALADLAQISDFYADVLGRQSYDNRGGTVYLFSCDADLLADNGKSLAYPEYGVIMLGEPVSIFSEPLGKAMDLVAHEYAHLVFQTEVGLSTGLDVTSVNEGIADIFGNLIELYVNGEQDTSWPLAEDAGYVKYNMADPLTMASYGNEEHDNAQILSHSAYLMWNGIDGTESKRLSEQQLAELWYRAVLMMPSDCDFILCRQLVEVAAQSMEGLTDQQRACVREAFDRVGIASSRDDDFHADYLLAEDATLTVYDQNNEPYSGYTLRFSGSIDMKEIASNMTPDIGWVVNRTVTVEEAGPYVLDLPQGRYTLTITDPHYDETYTIYVEISDEYTETNIDLITAYEEPLVVVIPKIDYENLVSDAYADAFTDDYDCEYCFHIPQFNLYGDLAQQVNQTIYDRCYSILERDAYSCMDEYGYSELGEMLYCWGYQGDLASVVIETNASMWADTQYQVYSISTATGSEVSMDDLLAIYGMDRESFYDLVHSRLNQYWDEMRIHRDNVGNDFFNDRVTRTLADENIRKAVPFINPDGGLSFVANIYSLAAGDCYWHLINAEGSLETVYMECTKDHSKDNATPTGDALQYFIENCDLLYFTEADIQDFDLEMCLYARNAVFAKSGRKFQNQELQAYFERYSWYVPSVEPEDFTNDMLNRKQLANVELVQNLEQKLKEVQEIETLLASLDGEEEIYTRYLHSGGYEELMDQEFDKNALEVSSCLADLDNDGTDELFLSLGTGQYGVRGMESFTFLLDIESGKVIKAAESYFGGGSEGGSYLGIRFDRETQTHVLVHEGHIRAGVEQNGTYLIIHDGPSFAANLDIEEHYYSLGVDWTKEYVDEICSETSLYYEDGYDFRYYQIDGQYVAKETFDNAWARYEEPKEGFQPKAGTYTRPIS